MCETNKTVFEKPLLVLDLDETLIHSSDCYLESDCDFYYPSERAIHSQYWVYKRPFLDNFINEIINYYRIGIWSSGTSDYVKHIVEKLQIPSIEFIWARDKCTIGSTYFGNYEYEKHLKKLTKLGYSMDRMLIVDDTPEKCKANYGNAIIVDEWVGNTPDNELELLLKYLILIKDEPNFRKLDKRNWKCLY